MDPRIQKEAGALVQFGYDVHVFGWDRAGKHPRTEVINKIEFRRTSLPAPYGSKWLLVFLPFFWIRAIIEIGRLRPRVVHCCDLDAFIPALALKPVTGHCIVYDIFDHFAEKMVGVPTIVRSVIQRVDQWLMRFADAIIVTDEFRKRFVPPALLGKTAVIMNVPPLRLFPETTVLHGTVRLCMVGAIHAHRGLAFIAEATREIQDIEVIFAGWIPRHVDEDFLLAQPHLKYLGKLDYLHALETVRTSDIVLAMYDPALPINAAASSNKVFEAMAASRPVITNRETSMAAIVEEVGCGILVRYGDVEALRRSIVDLRDSPGIRARLGERGRMAFESRYNWEAMETRLTSLYDGMLAVPGEAITGGKTSW